MLWFINKYISHTYTVLLMNHMQTNLIIIVQFKKKNMRNKMLHQFQNKYNKIVPLLWAMTNETIAGFTDILAKYMITITSSLVF